MIEFLKKPYPAHTLSMSNLYLALGAGLFIGLFLVFFQPFGLDEVVGKYKELKIFGFGVVTFIGVAFFHLILPRLLPSLTDDKTWTVGKEILYLNALLLTIALLNSLYNPILSDSNTLNFSSFLGMCFNTFSLGIIPSAFFVALDHNRLLRKHIEASESINLAQKTSTPKATEEILIKADNKDFSINPSTFLYAETVGNYVNVFWFEKETLNKELYRSTLKNLEENLKVASIIRCHRSFMVNLKQVNEITGNAQGFKLSLKYSEEIIPVSRKYVPVVRSYFQ